MGRKSLGDRVQIPFRLPQELIDDLKAYAAANNLKVNTAAAALLHSGLQVQATMKAVGRFSDALAEIANIPPPAAGQDPLLLSGQHEAAIKRARKIARDGLVAGKRALGVPNADS